MSRTKKPCPGCGKLDPYRPADKVCSACHAALRRSEKTDRELEAAAKQPGLAPVWLPWAIHAYPYIRNARDHETGEDFDRDFYRAADTLLRCSGVHAPTLGRGNCSPVFEYPKNHPESSFDSTVIHIERPVLDQWRKLHGAVQGIARTAHKIGADEGANMLARMARNEVTVADFNDWQERLRISK